MRYVNIRIKKQNLDKFIIEGKENLKSKFNVEDVEKEFAGKQAPTLLLIDDENNILMEFDSVSEFEKYAGKDLEEIIGIKKTELKESMKKLVDEKLELFNSKYPENERKLFSALVEEYRAYLKDNTVPTPTIDTFSQIRGISKEEMVQKIGEKFNLNVSVVAFRHKLDDQLDQIDTLDGIKQLEKQLNMLKNINTFEQFQQFLQQ